MWTIVLVVGALSHVAASFQPRLLVPPPFRRFPVSARPFPQSPLPGLRPFPVIPPRIRHGPLIRPAHKIDHRLRGWVKLGKYRPKLLKLALKRHLHAMHAIKTTKMRFRPGKILLHGPFIPNLPPRRYPAIPKMNMIQLRRRLSHMGGFGSASRVRQFPRPRVHFDDRDDDFEDERSHKQGFDLDYNRRPFRNFDDMENSFGHGRGASGLFNPGPAFSQIGDRGRRVPVPSWAAPQKPRFHPNANFPYHATQGLPRVKSGVIPRALGSMDMKQVPHFPGHQIGSGAGFAGIGTVTPNGHTQDNLMDRLNGGHTLHNKDSWIPKTTHGATPPGTGFGGKSGQQGGGGLVMDLVNGNVRSMDTLIAHAGPVFPLSDSHDHDTHTSGHGGHHLMINDVFEEAKDGYVEVEGASPIEGLELLGRSKWGDIMTELSSIDTQVVGASGQGLGEEVIVYPVNPHSDEMPTENVHIFHHEEATPDEPRPSGLVEGGAFSLLGIDPKTFASFMTPDHREVSDIATTVEALAPEHPPPIPLPSGVLSEHKDIVDQLKDSQSNSDNANSDTGSEQRTAYVNDGFSALESLIAARVIDSALENFGL